MSPAVNCADRAVADFKRQASRHSVDSFPTALFIPVLKKSNPRKGFFEHEAFTAVRRELSGEIQPIVTFACETGCRKSEIMGLRWSQVDLAERLIRLEPGE